MILTNDALFLPPSAVLAGTGRGGVFRERLLTVQLRSESGPQGLLKEDSPMGKEWPEMTKKHLICLLCQ